MCTRQRQTLERNSSSLPGELKQNHVSPCCTEVELQCGAQASLTLAVEAAVLAERGAVGGVPVPLEHGLELLLDCRLRGLGRGLVHHQRRPGRVQEVVT